VNVSVLDAWAERDWTDGIQIDELSELDSLSVRTFNSNYEIIVTAPASGEVLVRGGARFPTFTSVRLSGSTMGGSLVKRGGVYRGLRLEFERAGRRIVTSPVVALDFVDTSSEH
jgi:hypothetical protein